MSKCVGKLGPARLPGNWFLSARIVLDGEKNVENNWITQRDSKSIVAFTDSGKTVNLSVSNAELVSSIASTSAKFGGLWVWIVNTGNALSTGGQPTNFYWSKDRILDAGDFKSTRSCETISTHETNTVAVNCYLNNPSEQRWLDTPPTPGHYYIIAQIDCTYQRDSDCSNNTWVSPTQVRVGAEQNASNGFGKTMVYEFFNEKLGNYFRTGDFEEAAYLANNLNLGWLRTGDDFWAWANDKNLPSTIKPVCRFYGSVSPGPNSHFYTADPGECDGLKQLAAKTPVTEKRWNFESLAFAADLVVAGKCPNGGRPIYRLYNQGNARNIDSNHRLTTNTVEYQRLSSAGWKPEGVVMCEATTTSACVGCATNASVPQATITTLPQTLQVGAVTSTGSGTVTVASNNATLSQPGTVFIADGKAYKVVNAASSGGQTVVNVVKPKANEVLRRVTIKGPIKFSANNVVPGSVLPGFAVSAQDTGKSFNVAGVPDGFKISGDAEIGGVPFSGSIQFTIPVADADVDVEWLDGLTGGKLIHSAKFDLETQAKLALTAKIEKSVAPKNISIKLADFDVPIAATGGTVVVSVPIYLDLALEKAEVAAELKYSGSVRAGFNARYSPATDFVVNPVYENTMGLAIAETENAAGFNSSATLNLQSSLGIRPSLTLSILDLDDARIGGDVSLAVVGKWSGKVQTSPAAWCKDTGVDVRAGAALFWSIFDWSGRKSSADRNWEIDPLSSTLQCFPGATKLGPLNRPGFRGGCFV